MYQNLTEKEKVHLHTYNIYNILQICRSHYLPLTVHSTAIIFYRKLYENKDGLVYEFRLLLKAIVLLACKSENIHGDFTFLVARLKNDEKERVARYESQLAVKLKFDFHIPSPYLRILGYIVLLQERGLIDVKSGSIDPQKPNVNTYDMNFYEHKAENWDGEKAMEIENVDMLWEASIINMDKILLTEGYNRNNVKECALAALVLPVIIYKELIDQIDFEMVVAIRKKATGVKMPTEAELSQVFAKLNNK